MKIALFTDGIHPYVIGGMQKHSFYLAKYLARLGVEIDLYHTYQNRKEAKDAESLSVFDEEERKKINSFVIPPVPQGVMPGHYLKESYQYSIKLYNKFKDNSDVDFIYAKGFAAWKAIAEKEKGVELPPIAVKFHGLEMFQTATSFKERLEHWMFRGPVRYNMQHADHVFSYGGRITELTLNEGISSERIIDIPTGIAPEWLSEPLSRSSEEPIRFLFIGRDERRKGMKELRQAIEELLQERDDFNVDFVGPIPRTKHIISPNVLYHGLIKDPDKLKEIVGRCDCLLTPSYAEGMPNVIMEGMAQGLAIIASDVGAVNQMVGEENGILIKPANVEEIKRAMNKILADKTRTEEMRRASIEKVRDRFLWPDIAAKTLTEIESILNRD